MRLRCCRYQENLKQNSQNRYGLCYLFYNLTHARVWFQQAFWFYYTPYTIQYSRIEINRIHLISISEYLDMKITEATRDSTIQRHGMPSENEFLTDEDTHYYSLGGGRN